MQAVLDRISPVLGTAILSAAIAGTLSTGSAVAHETGDIIIRAGLTRVAPDVDSSTVTVATAGDIGMRLDVDKGSALGLNIL